MSSSTVRMTPRMRKPCGYAQNAHILIVRKHVLWCEEYTDLRSNKDLSRDKDLTTYYQQVMKMREKKDNKLISDYMVYHGY